MEKEVQKGYLIHLCLSTDLSIYMFQLVPDGPCNIVGKFLIRSTKVRTCFILRCEIGPVSS